MEAVKEMDVTRESQLAQPAWHNKAIAVGIAALIASWLIAFVVRIRSGGAFSSDGGMLTWLCLAVAFVAFVAVKFADKRFHLLSGLFLTVGINLIFGAISFAAGLPFYLDAIGTVIAGIVGGPLGAAVVATLTALIWGTFSTANISYTIIAVIVGAFAANAARRNCLANAYRMITCGILMGLIAGCLSAITALFAEIADKSPGAQSLIDFFMLYTNNEVASIVMQSVLSDSIDKAFTLVVACAFVFFSPQALCRAVLRPGYQNLDLRLFNVNLLEQASDGRFGFESNPDAPLPPFGPNDNRQ